MVRLENIGLLIGLLISYSNRNLLGILHFLNLNHFLGLEIFLDLKAAGAAILFSTHITSDLEKCADDITYIKNGQIRASSSLSDFLSAYRMLEIPSGVPVPDGALGVSRSRSGASVLLRAEDAAGLEVRPADLEEIMIHLEKEKEDE